MPVVMPATLAEVPLPSVPKAPVRLKRFPLLAPYPNMALGIFRIRLTKPPIRVRFLSFALLTEPGIDVPLLDPTL